ncbi:hypothetical protein D3C72_1917780 [compost metagenome]
MPAASTQRWLPLAGLMALTNQLNAVACWAVLYRCTSSMSTAAQFSSKSGGSATAGSSQPTLEPCSRRAWRTAWSKWVLPLPGSPHR